MNLTSMYIDCHKNTSPILYTVLRDVILCENGLVLDKNFNYICDDINQDYVTWENIYNRQINKNNFEKYKNEYAIIELPKNKKYFNGVHYFMAHVFGHHFEIIQKLKILEDFNNDTILITSNAIKHLMHIDKVKLHYDIFGFNEIKNNIIFWPLEKKIVYKVPILIVASPTCYPGRWNLDTFNWAKEKYHQYFLNNYKNQVFHKKLFLTRKHPSNRIILNEDEILTIAKENGFTIVDGSESLIDHMILFNQAKYLIGVHGSLFANFVFCQNPAELSVTEFCHKNRKDFSFKENAINILNVKTYDQIYCDGNDKYDIIINKNEVLKNVK